MIETGQKSDVYDENLSAYHFIRMQFPLLQELVKVSGDQSNSFQSYIRLGRHKEYFNLWTKMKPASLRE